MEEYEALQKLKHRQERALVWFIKRYTAYVSTILSRILGAYATPFDLEELASDVFLVLWNKADSIAPGKVKAYLGSVARNKAKDFLKSAGREVPLKEDVLLISGESPEHTLEQQELIAYLQAAIAAMEDTEREIFYRYYNFYQPVATIATEMKLNPSTVKTKLHRGRNKLKDALRKGGYLVEDENI